MILLPPIGIFAFWEYYKKGNVDIKAGIVVCIALLFGAALGGKFAQHIPSDMLRKGFAIFMLLISIKMLLGSK